MKVIVSHPTGNSNVRAVISSLFQENMLAEFSTSVALDAGSPFLKIFPSGIAQELMRRTFPIPANKIASNPWLELSRMIFPKMGLKRFTVGENSFASIDSVYDQLDKFTAKRLAKWDGEKDIFGVYAYEDGALSTFRAAKKMGLKCIYDLPIAYWERGRRLMLQEADRYPSWAVTLGGGITDSEDKLERKTKELEMADMVVVPGGFVNDSLPSWANNKTIHIAPFGSPQLSVPGQTTKDEQKKTRPLRVLFVGSMGQRKGLADLFAAMQLLNNPSVELVVMGSLLAPMEFYKQQFPHFTYEGGRAHSQVLELMRTCDVFCLPSIVEGRALVMQEAMSQGLPIIITPNTGGEDLIVEGETGFLVPIRSPESIAAKISWFLENRSRIPAMGKSAQAHAAIYTWAAYGSGITSAIKIFQA